MCLLALFFRVAEDAAVVVGANREEFYQRGGEPPRLLQGSLRAVAGVDPVAGGTWLGVNENGVLAAVTNRPKLETPPQPRSRGLLVREMLACPTAAAAVDRAVLALQQGKYAGANFLCADASRAVVIEAGDCLRIRPLPPGIHALANGDINDLTDPRLKYALDWLKRRPYDSAADCLNALRELCAQHEPDHPPLCFRHSDRGTVSSSIVALRRSLRESTYLHAQGPPCQTPYTDCSHLLNNFG
ncbi:MAG TPA: NRDE family protein [Gemmataceae bacterium]|nr:NRDE family protein [Gemmataceae bacterium]